MRGIGGLVVGLRWLWEGGGGGGRGRGRGGGRGALLLLSQMMSSGFGRNGHLSSIRWGNLSQFLFCQLEAEGDPSSAAIRDYFISVKKINKRFNGKSLSSQSIGKIADTTKAVPDRARGRKLYQWFPCIGRFMNAPRGGRMGACYKFIIPLKCADALRGVFFR